MDSKSEMKIVQKITKAFDELPDAEARSRVGLYVFSWLDAKNKPAAIAAAAPPSWIQGLEHGGNAPTVIHVPTEAGLPILEAGKR